MLLTELISRKSLVLSAKNLTLFRFLLETAKPGLDDTPVNMKELSTAMNVSRWTVSKWVEMGYDFQFGKKTTPRHCKSWLEENAARLKPKRKDDKEAERLEAKLAELK